MQVIEALIGHGCQKVCAANQFSLALAGGKVIAFCVSVFAFISGMGRYAHTHARVFGQQSWINAVHVLDTCCMFSICGEVHTHIYMHMCLVSKSWEHVLDTCCVFLLVFSFHICCGEVHTHNAVMYLHANVFSQQKLGAMLCIILDTCCVFFRFTHLVREVVLVLGAPRPDS